MSVCYLDYQSLVRLFTEINYVYQKLQETFLFMRTPDPGSSFSNIFEDRNIGFCIFSQKSFVSWEASLAPTHVRPLLTLSVSLDYGMSNIFWKIWPKAFHLAKKSTGPLPFNWPQILKMSNWQNHQIRPWDVIYFQKAMTKSFPLSKFIGPKLFGPKALLGLPIF